jgi:hypothetical protein
MFRKEDSDAMSDGGCGTANAIPAITVSNLITFLIKKLD